MATLTFPWLFGLMGLSSPSWLSSSARISILTVIGSTAGGGVTGGGGGVTGGGGGVTGGGGGGTGVVEHALAGKAAMESRPPAWLVVNGEPVTGAKLPSAAMLKTSITLGLAATNKKAPAWSVAIPAGLIPTVPVVKGEPATRVSAPAESTLNDVTDLPDWLLTNRN